MLFHLDTIFIFSYYKELDSGFSKIFFLTRKEKIYKCNRKYKLHVIQISLSMFCHSIRHSITEPAAIISLIKNKLFLMSSTKLIRFLGTKVLS